MTASSDKVAMVGMGVADVNWGCRDSKHNSGPLLTSLLVSFLAKINLLCKLFSN